MNLSSATKCSAPKAGTSSNREATVVMETNPFDANAPATATIKVNGQECKMGWVQSRLSGEMLLITILVRVKRLAALHFDDPEQEKNLLYLMPSEGSVKIECNSGPPGPATNCTARPNQNTIEMTDSKGTVKLNGQECPSACVRPIVISNHLYIDIYAPVYEQATVVQKSTEDAPLLLSVVDSLQVECDIGALAVPFAIDLRDLAVNSKRAARCKGMWIWIVFLLLILVPSGILATVLSLG